MRQDNPAREELKVNFEGPQAQPRNQGDQGFESIFSFYDNIESLKQKDLQLKKNFMYTIVDPTCIYQESEEIHKIL